MSHHYKLHKGLIVDIGDHSFELLEDVEAISMSETMDIVDDPEITMHTKLKVSEMNKLSSIVSDYIVAGGDLENMASAEKVQ